MAPVFGHGRLRLYLLKLLDESPRHGYEVIRLLEERFHGLYAPSAGTVYPRLAKLEQEGLITHTTEGGRKVYQLTHAGRAELRSRQVELTELEQQIRDSVSQLAGAIREDVRDSVKDLREELWATARTAHEPLTDRKSWHRTKETRELEHLLDRFRDDIRDAARDSGVSPAQLIEARATLAAAATQLHQLLS